MRSRITNDLNKFSFLILTSTLYQLKFTLFQKLLNEGVLPIQWLEACITAIYKNGLKDIVGKYRPVSLTSVICKVMESIVRDEVVDHMNRNNLLSNDQHGFVPRRNLDQNDRW